MQEPEKERIMIIDDEEYIRDILSRMLTTDGYRCSAFGDGCSALQAFSQYSFPLVLLDSKMPCMSGEEALKEITARYPETAVIMVTAMADVGTVVKMMKSGAYDYLVKPVDMEVLLLSVKRALEKRSLLVENRHYREQLEQKVKEQTARIRNNLLNSITSLVFALEAKDIYTSGHSQRVAGVAAAIAVEMGLGKDMVEQVRFAGLVHDIGKIGVRELVLNKNKELTEDEYRHISSHSVVGERILKPIMENEALSLMVRHHHERYDGRGYPDGLQGARIPLGSRILSVADTYDAMTSDRPYRRAASHRIALGELELKAGSQFDPAVVKAFAAIRNIEVFWQSSDVLAPDTLT
ncbi:MAG: HD domain-containing phosphohydrolase [Dehalococcoidales bacterium]|jgi:putative nucleotidyltransferase with HDIG domain